MDTSDIILQLRLDLQKLLAINANRGALTVDWALAIIGAFMLKNPKGDIKSWSSMSSYVQLLNNQFKGKTKSLLLQSSFRDAVLYVKKWLDQIHFEEKKGWLLSFGLKVIASVEDEGFLSFNDKTFNVFAAQNHLHDGTEIKLFVVSDLICAAGNTEECEKKELSPNTKGQVALNINTQEGVEESINKVKGDEPIVIKEPSKPKKKRVTKIVLDEDIANAIDRLSRQLPDKDEAEFVWQAKLSFEQYCALKKTVGDIFERLTKSQIINHSGALKILKYYVAEWWKREYHNNNAISPTIPYDVSESLVKRFGIDHFRIIKQTEWQDSIRALGGLPVYNLLELCKNNQSNILLNSLSKLFDPDPDVSQDYDETEDLFGNKTIARSNSVRVLIPYLRRGLFPYQEDDRVNEFSSWRFGDFIKKLQDGFERGKKEKFSIEYRFWSMPGFAENLSTCIRFKPNIAGDTRNFAINEEKLRSWGIPYEDLNSFSLSFSCEEKELKIPFFKCVNEDWVPFKCENIIKADFPLFKKIRVKINDLEIQELSSPATENGYVQMYSEDYRLWTSRRGKCSHYSIVIFDSSIWNSSESRCIGETDYEYVELKDGFCELLSNKKGKTIQFYNAVGNLRVTPKKLFFQESSFLNGLESKFPCLIQGQEEPTYVYVTDHSGFKVQNLLPVENLKEANGVSVLKQKDYAIEIYDESLLRFKEVSNLNDYLGYQTLRFTYYDKQATLNCFFVKSNAKIERNVSVNSKEGSINLSGLDCFKVSLGSDLVRINDNNNIVCKHDITKESRGCIIEIADEEQCKLQLEIAWPYDCADVLYRDGSTIRLYKGTDVPAVFAPKYEYRAFSNKGYSTSIISEDKRYEIYRYICRYFTSNEKPAYTDLADNEKISICSKTMIKVTSTYCSVAHGDCPACKFVFVPIDKGECIDLQLSLDKDNNSMIYLPEHIYSQRGIIIQSLNGIDPQEYFSAEYKPADNEEKKINTKDKKEKQQTNIVNYLELYNKKDFGVAIRAFKIGCNLKCYFGWFDELKALCSYPIEKRIVEFFKQYIDDCVQKNYNPNYDDLWRLAGEFMFDWLLLPAKCLHVLFYKNELYSESFRKLLLKRPGLTGSARYYTNQIFIKIVGFNDFVFRRANNIENKIAQCIRNSDKDKVFGKMSLNDRLSLMKKLTDSDVLLTVDCLLGGLMRTNFKG